MTCQTPPPSAVFANGPGHETGLPDCLVFPANLDFTYRGGVGSCSINIRTSGITTFYNNLTDKGYDAN